MNLYFAPLACSLATRVAFYEAGVSAEYTYVDTKAKLLADGSNYLKTNPMGQVPVLQMDDGVLLTENAAILPLVADLFPEAKLAPATDLGQAQMRQWLGFIGTELHKAVFAPLLDSAASDEIKTYARDKVALRFGILQDHLEGREFLLDLFTVADAYLVVVLNWAASTGIDLEQWPAIRDYHQRLLKRPSIAKAVGEEYPMYMEQRARRAKT